MPRFHRRDAPFIAQAVSMWARHTGQNVDQVRKNRFPKTIYLKNATCVSLDLYMYATGGVPVYCFDDGLKPTYIYEDVE